ncbi:TPA: hypothetical protein MI944_22495 [Klebsiella pneumoniae]|nr:hypothetical protein DMP51_25770 [Klebsiella pneumoniae]RYI38238.1 hypothetical protein EVY37_26810 [Klebsiella pneumoniae]RZG41674.1 hypothetical protein EXT45_00070 [Klebsiella pneumoniae]HBW4287341.1 hypothetical protein [Klebsiella pneumoniae]HBY0705446.1 hypothetical protein [Klebsiella pneumoniae]
MKDYMLDLEAERFKEWFAEQYPDAQPGGEEWEQAGLLYYWEQEALADKAQWDYERGLFVASLNNVHQRYVHANQELKKLYALLDNEQPELVYRMSFVHAVTVMEAYLMYCARALLEHDSPLKRFRDEYYLKSERVKKSEKHSACEMELHMFRPAARNYVSRMTFHNVKTIERYFGAVLHIPPIWPVKPLGIIADWRNDLVHRNGVDEFDEPRSISVHQLQNALQKVSDLIEAADMSLCLEVDYFGNWRNEENREIIASGLRIIPDGDAS